MPPRSKALATALSDPCAIMRSLGVLSDPWSFLLLREAMLGRRTFAEFRTRLGIATDVLSARLAMLVEHGVLERTPYREAGQRTRHAYTLTPSGQELKLLLVALQQWGDEHLPSTEPLAVLPVTRDGHERVHVVFVDHDHHVVETDRVEFAAASTRRDTTQ